MFYNLYFQGVLERGGRERNKSKEGVSDGRSAGYKGFQIPKETSAYLLFFFSLSYISRSDVERGR